ncbi:DNA polymerase I [Candidatus Margulisiibacteriota bacterium]
MHRIILIDGNSLAYRAFYALPDTMKTASGIPTNAIYGFTTMIMKILDKEPDFIAISFDLKAPTFRHKEYPQYKATRQKSPPTLHEQMTYVREVVKALGIPIYELEGYEADDVIGTLAREAEEQNMNVEIISGDKDVFQLISDKVRVERVTKGISETTLYDKAKIKERYNLTPEQIIDLKALMGDSSDNIPGVPGVGEKTALQLLKEFGSLDEILANADRLTKKALKEKIKGSVDLAKLSKRLATIVTNAPIDVDFKQTQRTPIDWKKVIPLFEKFEFKSLIKKHAAEAEKSGVKSALERKKDKIKKGDQTYILIDTEAKLKGLLKDLKKVDALAFDTETDGYEPLSAALVGISLCYEPDLAFYIPIKSVPSVLKQLQPMFEDEKIKKYGQNLKFDVEVLHRQGIEVKGLAFDTMLAAYLLDPTAKIGLKFLGEKYLNRAMLSYDDVAGTGAKQKVFSEVDLKTATIYSSSDSDVTYQLVDVLTDELKEAGLLKLLQEIEMPLLAVLINMEETGIYIDSKKLAKLSKKVKADLKKIEEQIYILAGEQFNINSPKQLQVILFQKLKIPPLKRTKTGFSTNAEVLEELAPKFEIARHLLEYRTLSKLLNTYIDTLPTLVNEKTGRVHSSFNQTITATGRLSSSNPNLQNIPAKGELAEEIRAAFVPQKKDHVILAADYSQVELRILAHLSQDEALIKAFKEDKDIHQATADELGIDRKAAKAVNFGIVYGISDFGLAKQLGIKRTEAKEYIDKYFAKHTGVKKFIEETIEFARKNGYVTTLLGRRRNMLDINSPNQNQRQFAERTAINTPVQGTAADMIKLAMVNINNKILNSALGIRHSALILQVHDELVFECHKDEVEKVKKIVEEEMVAAIKLNVPVKVDIGVGGSWGEAK